MNKESTSIFESYKLVKEQEMAKGQYGGESNPPSRPSQSEVQYNAQNAQREAAYAGRMASAYINNNPEAFKNVFRNTGVSDQTVQDLVEYLQSNNFGSAFYNYLVGKNQSSYENAAKNTNYADSFGDMAGRSGFPIKR